MTIDLSYPFPLFFVLLNLTNFNPRLLSFVLLFSPSFAHCSGGGAAFLVLGSRDMVAVYNLLTLQFEWTRHGHFSSIAVADSDRLAVRLGSGGQPLPAAWIAVGVILGSAGSAVASSAAAVVTADSDQQDQSYAQQGHAQDTEAREREKEKEKEKEKDNQCGLQLFSPLRRTPVATRATSAPVSSLDFWASTDITSEVRSGVAVLTTAQELLLVGPPSTIGMPTTQTTGPADSGSTESESHAGESQGTRTGAIRGRTAEGRPELALPSAAAAALRDPDLAAATTANNTAMAAAAAGAAGAAAGAAGMKADGSGGWLAGMLGASSSNIAPVSQLFSSFMTQVGRAYNGVDGAQGNNFGGLQQQPSRSKGATATTSTTQLAGAPRSVRQLFSNSNTATEVSPQTASNAEASHQNSTTLNRYEQNVNNANNNIDPSVAAMEWEAQSALNNSNANALGEETEAEEADLRIKRRDAALTSSVSAFFASAFRDEVSPGGAEPKENLQAQRSASSPLFSSTVQRQTAPDETSRKGKRRALSSAGDNDQALHTPTTAKASKSKALEASTGEKSKSSSKRASASASAKKRTRK
jgi:hypothetical protein